MTKTITTDAAREAAATIVTRLSMHEPKRDDFAEDNSRGYIIAKQAWNARCDEVANVINEYVGEHFSAAQRSDVSYYVRQDAVNALYRALKVLQLDADTSRVLERFDPMAFQQVNDAVAQYEAVAMPTPRVELPEWGLVYSTAPGLKTTLKYCHWKRRDQFRNECHMMTTLGDDGPTPPHRDAAGYRNAELAFDAMLQAFMETRTA